MSSIARGKITRASARSVHAGAGALFQTTLSRAVFKFLENRRAPQKGPSKMWFYLWKCPKSASAAEWPRPRGRPVHASAAVLLHTWRQRAGSSARWQWCQTWRRRTADQCTPAPAVCCRCGAVAGALFQTWRRLASAGAGALFETWRRRAAAQCTPAPAAACCRCGAGALF